MNHGINWKKREENLRALAAFYRKTYEGAVAAGRDDGGWVAIPSAERSRVAPGRMLARLDGLLVGSGFMFAPKAARNGAVRLVDGDESRWLNHAVPASCKAFCLPSEPPADWCEDAMAAWRSAERRAAAGVSADASESVVAGSPPSSECVRPSRPPTRHQAAMAERWRAQRFKSVADAARSLTSPLPFDERLAGQYRHLRFDRAAWDIAKSSYHPDRPEDAANYEADLSKHARPDGSFRAQRKGNRVFHPFHSCPKALRKRLWSFDGEPVAEAWDMSSGAVRCMLEVVAGETPENERAFLLGILRDPSRKLYREIAAEAGLGEGSAADVKTALLAFIHATPAGYRRFAVGGGRHGFRLPDGRWSERRDRAGMERRRRAADAVAGFFRCHAPRTAEALQSYGTMVERGGVDRWGRQTYRERRFSHYAWTAVEWECMSRAALSVIEAGVPCWTLHDALWCKASDLGRVRDLLGAADPTGQVRCDYLSI